MTPRRFEPDVVAERLRLLRVTLDELESQRSVTVEDLMTDPLRRAGVERLLQVAVDLAVDVNAHVVAAGTGLAPSTGRESFVAAAGLGALDADLGAELAPSASLRNILVHRYTDIRVDLVAKAIGEILDGYARYLEQMAAYVLRQGDASTQP